MALILCIETGTEICSAALALEGKIISIRESSLGRDHAKNLSVFIDEILRGSNNKPSSLDAVAVSMGPGSYTGLRIGVSTAKALCYALDIPLISIGSLDSLSEVAMSDYQTSLIEINDIDSAIFCPMIDARRMEVYTQMFSSKIEALSPIEAHILTPESFADSLKKGAELIAFGDGAAKAVDVISHPNFKFCKVAPSARGLARLAQQAYEQQKFADTAYFEPLYLKDFMIHTSKKKFF